MIEEQAAMLTWKTAMHVYAVRQCRLSIPSIKSGSEIDGLHSSCYFSATEHMQPQVTRGNGWLEYWLARARAARANALIPSTMRQGALLDLGCGVHPYFLIHTSFQDKVGMDASAQEKVTATHLLGSLRLISANVENRLPFDDCSFDVVTALAVIEHLPPKKFESVVQEIHRVLRPGGCFILTTPASWTHGILSVLALLHLVSMEEISDHQELYSLNKLREVFSKTKFQSFLIGSFEWGMNIWLKAQK